MYVCYYIILCIGNVRLFDRGVSDEGIHKSYIGRQTGFEKYDVRLHGVDVSAMTLAYLVESYARNAKYLVKLDCEGCETCVFENVASMQALLQAHYIAIEIHDLSLDAEDIDKVKAVSAKAVYELNRAGFDVTFHENVLRAERK